MRKTILAALVGAIVPLMFTASAGAAELKLFGGGHFQGSGQPLVEAFSKKTGIAASYTGGNTGGPALKKRLDAGDQMDVIVMNRDDIEDQAKAGLIKPDSIVSFARDRMAIAVPKGAPKPDISTPAKLRAVLLAAKAVGMQKPDPAGHSGANIIMILNNLGIFDEVVKKSVIINDASSALVQGKAEIEFWANPELVTRTDVEWVAPVPAELGGFTDQAVGILTRNQNDADAKAFIRFLTSADGQAVWTKTGLDPLAKKAD